MVLDYPEYLNPFSPDYERAVFSKHQLAVPSPPPRVRRTMSLMTRSPRRLAPTPNSISSVSPSKFGKTRVAPPPPDKPARTAPLAPAEHSAPTTPLPSQRHFPSVIELSSNDIPSSPRDTLRTSPDDFHTYENTPTISNTTSQSATNTPQPSIDTPPSSDESPQAFTDIQSTTLRTETSIDTQTPCNITTKDSSITTSPESTSEIAINIITETAPHQTCQSNSTALSSTPVSSLQNIASQSPPVTRETSTASRKEVEASTEDSQETKTSDSKYPISTDIDESHPESIGTDVTTMPLTNKSQSLSKIIEDSSPPNKGTLTSQTSDKDSLAYYDTDSFHSDKGFTSKWSTPAISEIETITEEKDDNSVNKSGPDQTAIGKLSASTVLTESKNGPLSNKTKDSLTSESYLVETSDTVTNEVNNNDLTIKNTSSYQNGFTNILNEDICGPTQTSTSQPYLNSASGIVENSNEQSIKIESPAPDTSSNDGVLLKKSPESMTVSSCLADSTRVEVSQISEEDTSTDEIES